MVTTYKTFFPQAAGAEADEESEAIADKFLKSDCDVDEFLKLFMVSRCRQKGAIYRDE